MKLGELKPEEFLRVTLTATLVVIGSRLLLSYTDTGGWLQQALAQGQQRVAAIIDGARTSSRMPSSRIPGGAPSGQVPFNTPASIMEANESVVMLSGNQSIGSGVILTSTGLVLTNSHVVRNGGEQWTVRLSDERELPARIVAAGNRADGIFYDLALVQIEGASNLPVARFSEAKPQAGEPVWAIGAPYGRAEVVTQGEVKKVTLDGILLTSTEVHPGNSGGPLLNAAGEVVGINTEINPSLPPDATTASISVPVLEQFLPQLVN
ncbi:MAG: trypsin-like serine protease [Cyanobacteria bacterium RM1_2_2]|nr:trypsin-like serine protease [Cyanobacteria bacterium RM1_2_2]